MITPEQPKPISRGFAMKVLAMFACKNPVRSNISGYCREVQDGFVTYYATDGCVLFTLRAPFEGEPERKNLSFHGDEFDGAFPNVRHILEVYQSGTESAEINLASWETLSRVRRKNQRCNDHVCVCPHGYAAAFGELNINGLVGYLPLHRAGTIYKAFRELHGKHSLLPAKVTVNQHDDGCVSGWHFETQLRAGATASIVLLTCHDAKAHKTISLDPETLNLLGLMWDEKDAQKRAVRAAERTQIAETYSLPL